MKAFIHLFLLVLVWFSDAAVNQSRAPKFQGTSLVFNQLGSKRSGPRASYSVVCGILDRRRIVIRDRETLADVWKQIYSAPVSFSLTPEGKPIPTLPPPPPQINFSRNMLLVVTMGSEPTSGYAITGDGVYEHGNQLEVVVRNVSPGRSCATFQSATAPVDIVVLEKREGAVTFRDLDIATDCNQTRP